MDVTRHNFNEALVDLEKQLAMPSCRFIAIDTEFTGLTPSESTREKVIDTLEERYAKVRASGENFLITQFGVALVHVEAESEKTWISCWNFYVFPRPYQNVDTRFLCQASSMQFMAEHGFDFNKFIRDGIPYLSRKTEMSVRKSTEKSIANLGKSPPEKMNVNRHFDKMWLAETIDKIDSWLTGPVASDEASEETSAVPSSSSELFLAARNPFRRLLALHAAKYLAKHPDAKSLYMETSDAGVRLVRTSSAAERDNLKKRKIDALNQEVDNAVGFSKVIQLLGKSNKPVIGHNCLLDFVYLFHQFCGPLPPTLVQFKQQLGKAFPTIYDTKVLALTSPASDAFESTSLSAMFDYMRDHLNLDVSSLVLDDANAYHKALQTSSDESMPCHEAGFDALMTAIVYLGFTSMAANGWATELPLDLRASTRGLELYENRINLMVVDRPSHLDVADFDQTLDRRHVYVLEHADANGLKDVKPDDVFADARVNRVVREEKETYVFLSEPVATLPVPKDDKIRISPFADYVKQKPTSALLSSVNNDDESGAAAPPARWCSIQ
ncbi:Aste57867_19993 [Aphanomyces stellatus]|uniref:Aste57867_19993 protein n=1 Tax=Aphanomyces stellatus TaxID=120398 RepID=A0A485LEI5_9STRA|nr:hypothetical protein As57867_019927 [Aphanomyces stellatus]VFT96690.1 Aste57867_19993 [Aphanomyces stellatus]